MSKYSNAFRGLRLTAGQRNALMEYELLMRRLQGAPVVSATLEDAGNRARRRAQSEHGEELVAEIRAAIEACDYRRAHRLGKQLVELHAMMLARPPRGQRPKCGAMTRKGTPCQMPALWIKGEPAPRNGRCRIHGGLSSGPKTAKGKAAIAESNRRRLNG